jgi:ethanolamine utilization protein EutN
MRIAKIIGTVTLNRSHPALAGASFRVAVPQTAADLAAGAPGGQEPIVILDELGAGLGNLVAISEGSEAAQPFHPRLVPIDAYNAAILDSVDLRNLE